MPSVVLYGDVSPNVIDGSSIWLISAAETLSLIFDEVHVLLKMPVTNERLVSSVHELSNVSVHEPSQAAAMTPEEAAESGARLVNRYKATAVVVRGMDACNAFCQQPDVAPLLWSYVTDLPFPPDRLSVNNINRLNRIASNSRAIFSQTEASRAYLEGVCPSAAGKTVLMKPMIPEGVAYFRPLENIGSRENPLRIVYSGKFAQPWKTIEMLDLPRQLRARSIESQLVVVGDKYNRSSTDPGWVERMRHSIEEAHLDASSGVIWRGALSRKQSLEEIRRADLGLGWRTRELDSSLEISTKALEYGSLGTAPILNRTTDHELLFGSDYPLFVDAKTEVAELAEVIETNLGQLELARKRAVQCTEEFKMSRAAGYLHEAFDRYGALPSPRASAVETEPTRVGIASHDLKFMGELMRGLEANASFEVELDKWQSLHSHDKRGSEKLRDWADVIFCEWAGPSLKWFSLNKRSGQRLIARLHRFEMNGPWMAEVDWDHVDQMIFVSSFIRDEFVNAFGFPAERTAVIPNAVDTFDFNRSKLPRAQFNLGVLGYVPFLKRPDRAIELFEKLLKFDDRYMLVFKGRSPWDYPYEWDQPIQKQAYLEFFDYVTRSPLLRRKVTFEPFGADVASWQRRIGFMLSPSSLESFHLAPAEGMAAGSIPIVWPREGATDIFGDYVITDYDSAIEKILSLRAREDFDRASQEAKAYAQRWDLEKVLENWYALLR